MTPTDHPDPDVEQPADAVRGYPREYADNGERGYQTPEVQP